MAILTFLRLCLIFLGVYIGLVHQCQKEQQGQHWADVVGLLLALLGTTTQAENQVKSGLLLDVVVAESATVFELLASKDQTLLVGRDTTQPSG